MTKGCIKLSVAVLLVVWNWQTANAAPIAELDYTAIGQKIYQNECAGKPENLLFWNAKEPFPSIGIGHFIWFPRGVDAPFEQTFPDFLRFVGRASPSTQIPISSAEFSVAPWRDRTVFYALKSDEKLQPWQLFLEKTFDLQTKFIVQRLQSKIPELIAQIPANQKQDIQSKIHDLMQTEKGLFALIDYSNFKGLGINPKERYQGQGWGLLQVLMAMDTTVNSTENALLDVFIKAAQKVLQQRTQLAANPELESTWLEGWFKRLDGYRYPAK